MQSIRQDHRIGRIIASFLPAAVLLLFGLLASSCRSDSSAAERQDDAFVMPPSLTLQDEETSVSTESDESADHNSLPAKETADVITDDFAPKDREKPKDAPTFANALEAKRAVLATLVLPYDASLYSEAAQEEYLAYKAYVNQHIKEVDEENAWLWLESSLERIQALEHESPYAPGPLPTFYISNPDNRVHNSYHDANIVLVYPDDSSGKEAEMLEETVQIKLRGNSTRDAEKQPYTLKFSQKVSLCSMDSGKKWVLLANAFDKTMLRNKLALDFCQNLRFDYSPECDFVDVYVDGRYRGVYLLCEPVTDGKKRVDIDTEAGDALLELESIRTEEGEFYIPTKGRVRVKVNKPEDISREKAVVIRDRLNEIEAIMENGSFDEVEQAVDLDSFVDFYIFKEYFKDVDAYYSSTRFYLKNNVLFAGPPWDCDLICGNASPVFTEEKYMSYCNVNGYGTNTRDSADGEWNDFGWFAMLWSRSEFRKLIRERWAELRPLCENLYRDNDLGQNRIDMLLEKYGADIDRNTEKAGWKLATPYSPYEYPLRSDLYEDHIAFLRDWMERRISVVDSLFADPDR